MWKTWLPRKNIYGGRNVSWNPKNKKQFVFVLDSERSKEASEFTYVIFPWFPPIIKFQNFDFTPSLFSVCNDINFISIFDIKIKIEGSWRNATNIFYVPIYFMHFWPTKICCSFCSSKNECIFSGTKIFGILPNQSDCIFWSSKNYWISPCSPLIYFLFLCVIKFCRNKMNIIISY